VCCQLPTITEKITLNMDRKKHHDLPQNILKKDADNMLTNQE